MSSAPAATPTRERFGRSKQGNGPLGSHPQRQKAIDAMVDGVSLREILKWLTPVVSLESLAKLRRQVISELDAARVVYKAKQLQAAESGLPAPEDGSKELTKLAVAGSAHVARIERLLGPLERQVVKADSEDDRIGLSTVAKTALAAIRTQAELDGSLVSTAVNQSVTNNILVLPFTTPGSPGEQAAQVIDTTAEPCDSRD